MSDTQGRAGTYTTLGGQRAFLPKPLPPDPPLSWSSSLLLALSQADQALGRLDAATQLLPNPDLFVAMYVQKEALLSSQIEGTQCSLDDLLKYQATAAHIGKNWEAAEVVNYVKAMNHGLTRLQEIPLCLRLLKEIHQILLEGVRGSKRDPGEFRRIQNWVGTQGTSMDSALFVPPPPSEVMPSLDKLEKFLHDESEPMPRLVKAGFAHAQFETIHPFLDGNGRMGRLLITFLLCWWGVLRRPLLYLSLYFKQHRQEYYEKLQATRDDGDWEGWLFFFLTGVKQVAEQASQTASGIMRLREKHLGLLGAQVGWPAMLEYMYKVPVFSINMLADFLHRSYPTARKLVYSAQEAGLLEQAFPGKRHRLYVYRPYLDLFEEQPGG